MTDKSFCPAVKDLLPLYEDGALSRETEELVSGHLRQCGACYQGGGFRYENASLLIPR